ncbi:hypothetical protein [Streptomyces sp. NPDC051684]|uniref:hypothetical protein n=1 Tax=Streptomyces sp. NPDC051684 TaxID=3365670 RepID=UPI00378F685D
MKEGPLGSSRTVSEWYGIPHNHPSDPACVAETSLVLAQVIAACHSGVGRLSWPALHREEVRWNQQFVQELEARKPGGATDRH